MKNEFRNFLAKPQRRHVATLREKKSTTENNLKKIIEEIICLQNKKSKSKNKLKIKFTF
jgi:hypothetical protein